MYEGANFTINKYISRKMFELILLLLCFTDGEDVEYNYGFFYLRQMEYMRNKNITDEVNLVWINLLDKIMMERFNNNAHRFVCIDHKPHPFGNDRRTICCDITSIFCRAYIV